MHDWQRTRYDDARILGELEKNPRLGIGCVTGHASGLVCVDVDPRNGGLDWYEANKHKLTGAQVERTGSGGLHLWFKHPGGWIQSRTGKVGIAPGVELKADGGHQVVIAPSIHPNGKPYVWEGTIPFWDLRTRGEPLPGWIAEATAAPVTRTSRRKDEFDDRPEDIEACRAALAELPGAVEGEGGDLATYKAMCLGRDYSLSPAVFWPLAKEWNDKCQPPWGDSALEAKRRSAYRHARNDTPGVLSSAVFPDDVNEEPTAENRARDPAAPKAESTPVVVNWQSEVLRSRDGWKNHPRNVELILTHDPKLTQCVRYNLLTNGIEIVRAPWRKWVGDTEWSDEDSIALCQWAARAYEDRPALSKEAVEQAIVTYARQFSYHPVRDYLTSLTWDGTPRLDSWLSTYIGVQASPYASAVGRCYLLGAVRRVMSPGCKFDSMLVIEGPQGAYKSTSLRVLFGDNWFTDTDCAIGTKDANEALRGKWCWEIGELAGMTRADIATIKGFLSRRVDRYRPAYARHTRDYPRQIVIAGTTNDDEYLKDVTGARRFWPVRCGRIDIDRLGIDRGQLWAEAYARYEAGAPSWLNQEESMLLAEEADSRYVEDVWTERVAQWLDAPDEFAEGKVPKTRVTTLEVYVALGGKSEHCDRRVQMRMADVMRRLNWQRVRRLGQGWGFERPTEIPTSAENPR
jgi:predicted P-loop ATPase